MLQGPDYFASDKVFDSLFPLYIQKLSGKHWTPIKVAAMAAHYLAPDEDARILDIGAGAGKFCITGRTHSPGTFTGIEQRKNFVAAGNRVIKKLGLDKTELICANFLDLDMAPFNSIYFYNSFHENLVISDSLDTKIERSTELYLLYTETFKAKLKLMPVGTRLATYYMFNNEIPFCYRLLESHFDDLLKFWVKDI